MRQAQAANQQAADFDAQGGACGQREGGGGLEKKEEVQEEKNGALDPQHRRMSVEAVPLQSSGSFLVVQIAILAGVDEENTCQLQVVE